MEQKNGFGLFFKALRKEKRIGLREFCMEAGIDSSNWSKVERGINPPPKDEAILRKCAKIVSVSEGSKEWSDLLDLAKLSRGQLPSDLLASDYIYKLPAFFRTMRDHAITEEELDQIVEFVKNEHTPPQDDMNGGSGTVSPA